MKKLVAFTLVAVFALVGFVTITAQAGPPAWESFVIHVVDSNNQSVAGAEVCIQPAHISGLGGCDNTDNYGVAFVGCVQDPGDLYLVTISCPGYDPYQEYLSGAELDTVELIMQFEEEEWTR